MAYPATLPADVAPGDEILASWGDDVRAALDFLANRPACRVHHSATQSLTNATETTVAFNSERLDTDTMHDTVTNNSRITINTAGLYQVNACLEIAPATDYTTLYAYLLVTGVTIIDIDAHDHADGADHQATLKLSSLWRFVAGDYIQIRALQSNTAAAARNIVVNAARSPEFSAVWVGTGN